MDPDAQAIPKPVPPQHPTPVREFTTKLSTTLHKRLRLEHSPTELEPNLITREVLFRAPPLTPELIGAIRQLSPQFHLRPTERSRRFWELNQNGLCWGEYLTLEPFLDHLGTPSRVLDIGPGLGRSAVFFKKIRGWRQVPFHLYDSSGDSTRYTKAGPRFDDSFCGNLDELEAVLRHNEVGQFEIFDAAELGGQLARLPGPYDFLYSFFAIGFHWSIEHFLDEILDLLTDRAIGAFTLHKRFDNLAALRQVPHRVEAFRASWPRGRRYRMLILARTEAAILGASRPRRRS